MTDEEFYARRRLLEERERWALAMVDSIRQELTDLMNAKLDAMLEEEKINLSVDTSEK